MENEKQEEVVEQEVTETKAEEAKVEEPKAEEPKKESNLQDDGSYKLNLSETDKNKKDALREEIKDDEKSNEEKIVKEEKNEEVETSVIEEITDEEEVVETTEEPPVTEQKIEDLKPSEEKTPEMELPENVEKLVKFMNETGGTLEDYVKLNADYSKLDDGVLLNNYYQQTKGHLTQDEINFLIEDKFSFDEEVDEPKDIKRKKLAYKEAVAEARGHLENMKEKYYDDLKLGSKLPPEQQKAVDFFNRYNKEQEQASELQQKAKLHFNKETDKVFSDNFKGFDFKIGDKKYRYNVKDAAKVKESQSDFMNIFKPYMDDETRFLKNASDYHKTLFAASNADAIANHFYEQGKADGIKQMTSEAKNIKMDARQSSPVVDAAGTKVRVISGDDSSKLKIKLKNY
tara:strand:- start:12335 stop:13537 length:1203 start_codon:yes stop_codon:yes gene_type:complete